MPRAAAGNGTASMRETPARQRRRPVNGALAAHLGAGGTICQTGVRVAAGQGFPCAGRAGGRTGATFWLIGCYSGRVWPEWPC